LKSTPGGAPTDGAAPPLDAAAQYRAYDTWVDENLQVFEGAAVAEGDLALAERFDEVILNGLTIGAGLVGAHGAPNAEGIVKTLVWLLLTDPAKDIPGRKRALVDGVLGAASALAAEGQAPLLYEEVLQGLEVALGDGVVPRGLPKVESRSVKAIGLLSTIQGEDVADFVSWARKPRSQHLLDEYGTGHNDSGIAAFLRARELVLEHAGAGAERLAEAAVKYLDESPPATASQFLLCLLEALRDPSLPDTSEALRREVAQELASRPASYVIPYETGVKTLRPWLTDLGLEGVQHLAEVSEDVSLNAKLADRPLEGFRPVDLPAPDGTPAAHLEVHGDQVRGVALDWAAEELHRILGSNPALAAAMNGVKVELTPIGTAPREAEAFIKEAWDAWSIGPESSSVDRDSWKFLGSAGQGLALMQGSPKTALRDFSGDETLVVVPEGSLLPLHVSPVPNRNNIAGRFWTLRHELGHIIHWRYVASMPAGADHPVLGELFQSLVSAGVPADRLKTGDDVIREAFLQRKSSGASESFALRGRLTDVRAKNGEVMKGMAMQPRATDPVEWFAESTAHYLTNTSGAVMIDEPKPMAETDPVLFRLFEKIFRGSAA
jgi:hypothetical protein